jgi:ABC-2 type transport system permease protein
MEDSYPFYWLYSKVILVLGTIFPIEYFPHAIQPILSYSPIYVVSYGPAKLFVDFSYSNFITIIIAQVIYIIISYLLCSFLYRKGVKKLNVNGG